jgi:hypothetical protein
MHNKMAYMELIQIIYEVLILGGALLVVVISISFFLSRFKKKKIRNTINNSAPTIIPQKNIVVSTREEFLQKNNKLDRNAAIVYQIDPMINRDLKLLRKSTVTKTEIQDRNRQEEMGYRKTKDNRKRYTIVNEEMRKTVKQNVINF